MVEFAGVVLLYLVVVVDYSFFSTATRKIAAFADNREKVSLIFSSVMVAKAWLFAIALAVFVILIVSVGQFQENALLLWLSFPIVLGWALYPNFLFYGVQKVGVMALANVVIKGLAALLLFVFINQEADYYYVTFINGITQVGVGILTLWYAFKKIDGLRWIKPKTRAVKAVLWEGRFVFVSNFFTRIYGFSSILIGGFLLSPLQLGLFAAASKLINVAQSFLFQPLHGALYPFLSQKHKQGMAVFKKAHTKSLWLLAGATALVTLSLALLAPWAIKILFGADYQSSSRLLVIMSPMLFVGAFAHMSLQQGLLILRKDKGYMYVIIGTGVLSILLNIWWISAYGVEGAAWVRLTTETLIAIGAVVLFYKNLNKLNATD